MLLWFCLDRVNFLLHVEALGIFILKPPREISISLGFFVVFQSVANVIQVVVAVVAVAVAVVVAGVVVVVVMVVVILCYGLRD